MAEVPNDDSIPYDKEKESFLRELQEFHDKRGTPFKEGPKISGRIVDLHLLYDLVTGQGGWVKVNSRNDWDKILDELKLPASCVNCSVAIKQIYLRYLDRYEEVYFFGEIEERGLGDDEEDSRSRKLTMRALHSVPHMYNHIQHSVNESLRECNGLSIDLYSPSEYDKLALSLLSPLINEQDFAINVCTLLSYEGKHCLKLQKHPRILHYLLAHAAVFAHSNIRNLFCNHYARIRGNSMSRFWQDALNDVRLIRLIDETRFEENEYEDIPEEELLLASGDKARLIFEPEDTDLFCLGRTLGTQEFVGQRVLQIATILRNLTFVQENISIMSKDLTFLRFVVLCCGSNWNTLHQIGWDMLGNISQEITVLCPLMPEILDLTVQGLESPDRAQILSSLEVLNKLGQNDKNEDYFLKYLQNRVYDRVCSFLSIQDIMLLIYTLECLYSLSSMGEKACDAILRVHGVLDTLVALVTVEAQSYGPKACIQMKVVETVTGVAGTNIQNGSIAITQTTTTNTAVQSTCSTSTATLSSQVQVQQLSTLMPQSPRPQVITQSPVTHVQQTIQSVQQVVTHVATPAPSSSKVAQTQVTHITPSIVHTQVSQASQSPTHTPSKAAQAHTQLTHVVHSPQGHQIQVSVSSQSFTSTQFQNTQTQVAHIAPSTSQAPQPPALSLMQMQPRPSLVSPNPSPASSPSPQQVVQENERFVLAWLKNTFEPESGSRIEQQELYKKYIDYCVKIGRRGVIAPLHFPRYVRSVFGVNVGPNGSGESSQLFFDGIRLRADPLVQGNTIPSVIPQTLSPLLKAQLSAPLKPSSPTPQLNKAVQRQLQQKILQQAQENRQPVTVSAGQMCTTTTLTHPTSVIQTIQSMPSSSTVSVIEKNPANIIPSVSSAQITGEDITSRNIVNGGKSVGETKCIRKEDMETESVVSSTSGENNSVQIAPATSCIKVTSSTTDHEYAGSALPTVKIEIKNESTSNDSSDSSLVNGLTKVSEQDNSKESVPPKKLMLADLLEKNVDKVEPTLNNVSLRIGEKGLELVSGPEKEDSTRTMFNSIAVKSIPPVSKDSTGDLNLKRVGEEIEIPEVKKSRLNGDSPLKEETPEEGNVSSSAANLYAALAADALEDEPIEETPKTPVIVTAVNQPRPILLAGSQIAQSVIVGGQHYIVTQPQTTLVQGQPQTVLVAQTSQQQGLGAKTIIFLQPQNISGNNSQQKVLVQNIQSPAPPPLISTSQPTPVLRAKSSVSQPPSSPLLQQAILRHNLAKSNQPQTIQTTVQSPQKPTLASTSTNIKIEPQSPSPSGGIMNIPVTPSVISSPVTVNTSTSSVTSTVNIPHASSSNISPIKQAEKGRFLCEWRGCMRNFRSAGEVYMHACESHCPEGTKDIQCLWQRCDAMKRKRFSHMTHLYNRHCNAEVMRLAAERSKQLSASGRTEPPPPTLSMPHPGYAPNAALLAINRHASDYVNPKELQDDNEGPVTKSIRLTSALILRNLVIFSTNGRRHMSRFEPHLANVALSGVESSRTIAHILYDMSQNRWHSHPLLQPTSC